jgi:hypothetical protein
MKTRRLNIARWRPLVAGAAALTVALAPASPLRSLAPQAAPPTVKIENQPDAFEQSVAAGVAYLITRQAADGSISPDETHATALTALSVLAMIGVGHQLTDPTPEGQALRKALAFILREDRQDEYGYFGERDGSRMYGHGITTLLLGELLGMGVDEEQDAVIRQKLTRAVELILRSQRQEKFGNGMYDGGWRYTPGARDADLSITVWQVMALRSALAADIEVPASAVDEAVEYLRRSYEPEQAGATPMGRFGYQPRRSFGYATTAAGLLAMQVCGRYEAPEVEGAANWLLSQRLDPDDTWFFYGTYYYAQGLYQRGGEEAEVARARVESTLLSIQHENGSWSGSGVAQERVYATSMALLSLSVRYHYLPIYQR